MELGTVALHAISWPSSVLRLARFYRRQTYQFKYTAQIHNRTTQAQFVTVVMPLPLQQQYQETLEPVLFSVSPTEQGVDQHKNQYAVWQLELKPRHSYAITETGKVVVAPRRVRMPYYAIDDYQSIAMRLDEYENSFIDAHDPRILDIAKRITSTSSRVDDIIRACNAHVTNMLKYGDPITGLYSSRQALELERVDCGGFDTLLCALCIACGIPARVVAGFWAGYAKNGMHAWAEIMLPNQQWVPADPSMQYLRRRLATHKSGSLAFVGSDRIAFSQGNGNRIRFRNQEWFIDILQTPAFLDPIRGVDIEYHFETSHA